MIARGSFTPNERPRESRACGLRGDGGVLEPRELTPCPRCSALGRPQDDGGNAEAQDQPFRRRDLPGRRGRLALHARYGGELLAGCRRGSSTLTGPDRSPSAPAHRSPPLGRRLGGPRPARCRLHRCSETRSALLLSPGHLDPAEKVGDVHPKLWCALSEGRVVVFDASSWTVHQQCFKVGAATLVSPRSRRGRTVAPCGATAHGLEIGPMRLTPMATPDTQAPRAGFGPGALSAASGGFCGVLIHRFHFQVQT